MQTETTNVSIQTIRGREKQKKRKEKMPLTGFAIKKAIKNGDIEITPYNKKAVGPNSVDVNLGKYLAVYTYTIPEGMLPAIPFDSQKEYSMRDWFVPSFKAKMDYYENYRLHPENYDIRNPKFYLDRANPKRLELTYIEIPETGLLLNPQFLFLGYTLQQVYSKCYSALVNGKSSWARVGLTIHETASNIIPGFKGQIVLEMKADHPLVIYPYTEIAQFLFEPLTGKQQIYDTSSAYQNQTGPKASKPLQIMSSEQVTKFKKQEQSLLDPKLQRILAEKALYRAA